MSACWSRRDWTFKIDPSHTASMRASLSCDDDKTCCSCVDVDERSSSTSSSSLNMIDVRWWLRDSINQTINQVTSLIDVVRWLVGWYTTPTQSHDSSTETKILLSLSLYFGWVVVVEVASKWMLRLMMLVFEDAVVVVVLEEQRSFDDDDEIDVQQLQIQPITQYNQHRSLSIICIEAHTRTSISRGQCCPPPSCSQSSRERV